jgi:hypothetical protein
MGFDARAVRGALDYARGYDQQAVVELLLKTQELIEMGCEFGHAVRVLKQCNWDDRRAVEFEKLNG